MKLTELLTAHRKGHCLTETEDALREVVAQAMKTGKPGKLTLTLLVSPADNETVVIKDNIESKIPKPEKNGCIYFPDDDGELHRDNPKQGEFDVVKNAVNE